MAAACALDTLSSRGVVPPVILQQTDDTEGGGQGTNGHMPEAAYFRYLPLPQTSILNTMA